MIDHPKSENQKEIELRNLISNSYNLPSEIGGFFYFLIFIRPHFFSFAFFFYSYLCIINTGAFYGISSTEASLGTIY